MFLWNKIAHLGLIHFWIGLPVNINTNVGQNKFEDHILKNVAKITNYLPKMSQDATFGRTLNGHTFLALICPALGGQIDFNNLALRAGQEKAGQNEARQIKGQPKLGQLEYIAQIIRHFRFYV